MHQSTIVYSLKLVKDRTVSFPISEVRDSHQASNLIHTLIGDKPSEHMVVVFLDVGNKVIGTTVAFSGGTHGVSINARDLFRAAIVAQAHAIVLGHNHPSGNTTPSQEDIATTRKLIEAGRLIGVPIVDHIIVGLDATPYSMHERMTVWF